MVYQSRRSVEGYGADVATERDDLGALLHRLLAVVLDRETALLGARGLEMWDYVVLSGLRDGAAPTQAQLAAAVGRDRTRIITTLDRLQSAHLVDRRPDPADRRNRVVTLTDDGRALLAECRAEVRAMEDELLGPLGARRSSALLQALEDAVAAVSPRTG